MDLKEVSSLRNKIEEVLSRSNSTTLKSQRTISSPVEVSYSAPIHQQHVLTIETNKTASYPLYSSHINVSSPTYSYASPRTDVFRPVNNYQVKTIHDLGSSVSPLPAHYHVQEVRSATYPSHGLHTVGYDRQKLDQIIARIQQNTPSHIPILDVTKTLSAPIESKKSARPQQAFRNIEADEESFIRDRKTKKSRAEEEDNQEADEEQNEAEQESPIKRKSINKRQEVLSAKKQPQASNNNEKEVSSTEPQNSPKKEEASKGSAPASAQDKKNEEKNELVMLAKKPSLRNSYFFGKEQRRGGSSLLQDNRFRE